MPGGSLSVLGSDEIIPLINHILPVFDLVIAVRDWHSPDHVSFVENHPGHKVGEVINLNRITQILWAAHCIAGTKGAEFSPELDTARVRKIINKGVDPGIDSYSCFWDNEHLRETELNAYLQKQEVTDVYFAGIAIEYCVKYSVIDAISYGYKTNVIIDACRGIELNKDDIDNAVKEMAERGVRIINSSNLC
jgi:nicotinamidase/pyrazinamidase